MQQGHSYEIKMSEDRVLRGDIHLPDSSHWPAPILIFCHGFKGFKDWGGWPWMCQELAQKGYIINRFNFSHSGVGPALDNHDEEHKFAKNTYGLEMDDLRYLIEHQALWQLPKDSARDDAIGVIGHSRGGSVALMTAAEELKIAALMTLAAPGRSQRFDEATIQLWREQGHLEVKNARTGQILKMDQCILDDWDQNQDRYSIAGAIKARVLPTFVVHGTGDETVGHEEAKKIHSLQKHPHSRLEFLDDANHIFECGHPFEEASKELEWIVQNAANWFSILKESKS